MNSVVRFADKNIQKAFFDLEKGDFSEKQLFKIINQALENIENNVFCGIQIPKRIIPKEYEKKFGVKNLWKYDLPRGWRLVYSILDGAPIVVSLVLEWFSHKEYERRFKY